MNTETEMGRGNLSDVTSPVSPPETILRSRKKEKIFKAGMTRDGWLLLALLCLPAAVIIWQGAAILTAADHRGLWFVGGGGAWLVGVIVYSARQLDQCIRVTPECFVFEHGNRRVAIQWEDMKKFTPPGDWQRHFRVARLGDGDREVRFSSTTFMEFDLLISLITVARKSRGALRDTTYQL